MVRKLALQCPPPPLALRLWQEPPHRELGHHSSARKPTQPGPHDPTKDNPKGLREFCSPVLS